MFDNLYNNIGSKIKSLAKWTFIIESIATIITGISLFVVDDDFILLGILAIIGGPMISWVSSCFLYAFGELVEKVSDNEENTKAIVKLLRNDTAKTPSETYTNNCSASSKSVVSHRWICDNCEKMRSSTPCEHCGK